MIYLHIGTHKTGTTAIQLTLKDSVQTLQAKGFYYDSVWNDIGYLLSARSPLKDEDITRLRSQADEYTQDVIISSEGFMGDPNTAYANIEAVASDAKKIFGDMKVIAYYRPQVDFIESWYAHLVKDGGCLSFADWLKDYPWKKLIWSDLFAHYDNVTAVPYYADSLTFMDLPITIGANPSVNRRGLDLALKVNPYLEWEEKRGFRKYLEENYRRQIGEKLNFISDDLRKSMMDWYAIDELFSKYHLRARQ